MTTRDRNFLALLAIVLGSGLCANAQNYSIYWFKISGGGGTSTGGVYSVSGTIGQPDAGASMSGGNYSLIGGFWSLVAAVQTTNAPRLNISRAGTSVVISWPYPSSGWALEQKANVVDSGFWSPSTYTISTNASVNSITIAAPTGSLFFRLHLVYQP
jgi:hypothetical protein